MKNISVISVFDLQPNSAVAG